MERSLGADFASVRVHESAEVTTMGALAYARGDQIYFRPGAYDPSSPAGQELLGHELTHVVQQRAGRVAATQPKLTPGRAALPSNVDASLEAEADEGGRRAAAAAPFEIAGGAGKAPRSSGGEGSVAQFKPTTFSDFTNKGATNKIDWAPHRTQDTKTELTDEERIAFGSGARVRNTVEMKVPWSGVAASALDGATNEPSALQVRLTPKVQPGPVPDDSPRAATLEKAAQTASKKKKKGSYPYATVQLVPADLGGDDADENVVVVPEAAWEDIRKRVHKKLFALVGSQSASLLYSVAVTHTDDANAGNARYASRLRFTWHEVDGQGVLVAGTEGEVTVEPASPSDYAGGVAGNLDIPATIGLVNNRAALGNKTIKRDAQSAVDFHTEIEWSGTNDEGDGVLMEARKLGPDHKMGEEPKTGSLWSARVKQMQALAKNGGNPKKYVAGHLLNHQLGGPGNDARNLAPIPGDANTKFEKEVEAPVKAIVNEQKGWAYYKVEVVHDTIAKTTYPSKLKASWHQLDEYGDPVANTVGMKTISMAPPSSGGAYTVKHKQVDAGADSVQPGTAKTDLAFYEMVLDNEPSVLRSKILIMRPLVQALQSMDLSGGFMRTDLTRSVEEIVASYAPQAIELAALKTINDVTAELGLLASPQDVDLKRLQDADDALQTSRNHRGVRSNNALRDAQDLLDERFEDTRAQEINKAFVDAANQADEALTKVEDLAFELLKLAEGLHKSAEARSSRMFEKANEVRFWMGLPPLDAKTSSFDDAAKDLTDRTQEGVQNVREIYEHPGSPMQVMDYGESEGYKAESSDSMRGELSKGASDFKQSKNKAPLYGKTARSKLDEKMLAILCDDAQRANVLKNPWTGGKNEVATTVFQLATMIEMTKGTVDPSLVAKHAIADLYRTKTTAFSEFYKWLEPLV
jgi:Domain of unknown function (DUF4157)